MAVAQDQGFNHIQPTTVAICGMLHGNTLYKYVESQALPRREEYAEICRAHLNCQLN